ncbi:MAG: radical SAM protein [Firmicutes bacterium]|nr:radical SAM protein [Bacillota bacterium]MDY4960107.1 radical SAM protein [Lentihominibacter sp.]
MEERKDISFRIGPIRPPSEADSLLIQVTRGCTWNRCKFCQLYRHTQFKAYSADSVKADIDNMVILADRINKYKNSDGSWDIDGINLELGMIESYDERQSYYMMANWLVRDGRNVFLQDGNTTVLKGGRLSDVIRYLKQAFPQIERITSYGRAENLSKTSPEEFADLKDAGLDRIHSGFETGSDKVLQMINKGVTQEQEIIAGRNVKAGGIELSIYFMAGVGGHDLTEDNAEGTAYVINQVNPDFVRVRTAAYKPGTELYDEWKQGLIIPCTDEEKLLEIRRIIELAEGVDTKIVSDHILNLLMDIEGSMVKDKERLLAIADEYLNMPKDKQREFQLARRMNMVVRPSQMQLVGPGNMQHLRQIIAETPDDRDWEDKINMIIERYI